MPIFCLGLLIDCACRVDAIEVSVVIIGAGLFRHFWGHGRSQVAFFVFLLLSAMGCVQNAVHGSSNAISGERDAQSHNDMTRMLRY